MKKQNNCDEAGGVNKKMWGGGGKQFNTLCLKKKIFGKTNSGKIEK